MQATIRYKHIFLNSACAALCVLMASCASSIAPGGGPPDTEPPAIVETSPVHGATNIQTKKISFRFSEYVNRSSFQQAIHIAPLMEKQPKFDWSGKEVTLILPDSLKENTTYVISVGTNVKDVNGGNTMQQSYTLAFSTGDSLDTGILRGRVFDEKPQGITIFAYRLDRHAPDTLNPATVKPDYAIQTGDNGRFVLSNLAQGYYRLFAIMDKQNNYLYDTGSDAIGIPLEDVGTAMDSLTTEARFLMMTEDTTAPYIQSIRPMNERSLELRISEQPLPHPPLVQTVHVQDSASATPLTTVDIIPNPSKKSTYLLYMTGLMDEAPYHLFIDSLRDETGNTALASSAEQFFQGSSVPDTIRPEITSVFPPRGNNAVPVDSTFLIEFSRPMQQASLVILKDSSGTEIALEPTWDGPHRLLLRHSELAPKMAYSICLHLHTFADSLNMLPVADTAFCYSFQTAESEITGSITGTIISKTDSTSRLRVTAKATSSAWVATATASPDGAFAFPSVPEGKYLLSAYTDTDSSSTYSHGKPFPFHPAERFGIRADTIRVRARWETEHTDVVIP